MNVPTDISYQWACETREIKKKSDLSGLNDRKYILSHQLHVGPKKGNFYISKRYIRTSDISQRGKALA